MENQKIIIALIAAMLTASLFLAVFLLVNPSEQNSRQRADILEKFEQDQELNGGSVRTSSPVLLALSERRIVSPVPGKRNNSALYYEQGSGKVFDANIESGKITPVSEHQLDGYLHTYWSPRRSEVIGAFAAKQGVEYRYYDFDSNRSAYLGTQIKSLAFSPSGVQIVQFQSEQDLGTISVSGPDGTVSKKIFETRLADLSLFWPREDIIAFIARDGESQYWHLYTLTQDGKLERILEFKRGLSAKFSQDGTKLLYSALDETGTLSLKIRDLTAGTETDLNAETFASKCTWSIDGKTVVCGVPTSSLGSDPALSGSVSDELYEISTADGSQKPLWTKSSNRTNINVREIFLSSLEDYVVFLNSFDERLYSLPR